MLLLHDLQSSFRLAVFAEPATALLDLICDGGIIEPLGRLSIYRNNIIARLSEVLAGTFPVVRRLVDPRFFEYAAKSFLRENLPAHSCLAEFGEAFPSFLSTFVPAARIEYLADLARLEWSLSQARRAAAAPQPIPIARLASLTGDPSSVRLDLEPSARFVASAYPIDQIWRAHQDDDSLLLGLTIEVRSVYLQVNHSEVLKMVGLPPDTWKFRFALAEGDTLGTAYAAARAITPDFDLASALASLFHERLVVGAMSETDV